MIREETFAGTAEEFAAKRRKEYESTDAALYPHVAEALKRAGIPNWEYLLIDEVSKRMKDVALSMVDEWTPQMQALRADFERALKEVLPKTKPVDDAQFVPQVERMTRWLSTMMMNAAAEAVASSSENDTVGLEWVTMEDDNVRHIHREAHGQKVKRGHRFQIGKVKMLYPGEPVGDPENWINCRCAVRPVKVGDSITAGVEMAKKPEDKQPVDAPADQPVDAPPVDTKEAPVSTDGETENTDEEPQMIPDEEADIPVPWHGVLAPEGVPSGDGRMFAPEALTWRDLPLPMKAMFIDDDGHKGSSISARIDRIWRDGNLIKAEGVFDFSEAGYESVRMLAESMWRGVSVDVDQAELAMEQDQESTTVFSKGRISAATICAIPAFAEAFIALGTWADVEPQNHEETTPGNPGETDAAAETEEFDIPNPRTMDGPGWITDPVPTHRITHYWVNGKGAAKIKWGVPGDFNRCRRQLVKYVQNPDWLAGLCANLHYRALGMWPGQEGGGKAGGNHGHAGETVELHGDENAEMPSVVLTASADMPVVSADYFRLPELEGPTPLTITDDGHIFGHLADWTTCHIGFPNECKTAPHSATDYAYFHTGEVMTDAGPVAVGQITLGGGHASGDKGVKGAISHYDSTSSAVADIVVGEDAHGIVFSGKVREGIGPKVLHALRAAALSGDWRGVIAHGVENLELVAALAVNVPGFPIPRPRFSVENGRTLSLVAAGVVQPEVMLDESETPERYARVQSLRSEIRALRASNLQSKINKIRENHNGM